MHSPLDRLHDDARRPFLATRDAAEIRLLHLLRQLDATDRDLVTGLAQRLLERKKSPPWS